MRIPLHYQTSEYDCGPVSMLNGIRFLFDREEIPPEIVKFIMLYSMDTFNEHGQLCRHGTSAAAIHYISNWLNHFAQTRRFPLHCTYFSGETVALVPGGPIWTALEQGAAVLLRVSLEVWHYVLLTGVDGDRVLLFDPYYEEEDDPEFDEEYRTDEIRFLYDCPKKANRSVLAERLNRTAIDYYQMGDAADREAVILCRTESDKHAAEELII